MEKWMLANKKADFKYYAKTYGIDPVIARIMINRGVRGDQAFKQYLYGGLSDLHEPGTMKDLEKGVDHIWRCIQNGETICIASDFDVDGIFAGYILWKGIKDCGGKAYIVAPDRVQEGYGLNERIVLEARDLGASCILTCDNGIAAFESIKKAKLLGLKVIVTDHHEPVYTMRFNKAGEEERVYKYPEADAVIDPKQWDCPYPFKGLCGAGVAYKFVEVLFRRFDFDPYKIHELVPFTAIATVADVMDLVDENRIFVKYGLKALEQIEHPGLRAIIHQNQLKGAKISSYHIGFVIGPCFNAAGRLDNAKRAIELLQTDSVERAEYLATELVELNESRKKLTVEGYEQAILTIKKEGYDRDKVMVLCLEDCHESLAGIIAGRIKEKYHRPVIVGVETEHGIKASGRSIEAYNMFEKLNEHRSLFLKFGGHAMAAGMTFTKENLPILRETLNAECGLTDADLYHVIHIDVPMPLEYISEKLIDQLELLEPFGKGNVKPVFAERHFHVLRANILGKNQNVLKMNIQNDQGMTMEALYFGEIDVFNAYVEEEYGTIEKEKMYQGRTNCVDLAFTYYPSVNEYRGERKLQIIIQNFQRIPR